MENENTNRPMFENMKVQVQDMEPEHPALNWAKISGLLCFTFGLIAIIWLISNAIEHMKGPTSGTVLSSFTDAGGLIFGLFCFYVLSFGVAWYFGHGKRDQLRRDAVEKQIAKERALNALQNID